MIDSPYLEQAGFPKSTAPARDFPERHRQMNKTFEILARLIDTEEASMRHWSDCGECGPSSPTCAEGRKLMMENITATLEAKVHVDRARKSAKKSAKGAPVHA